MQRNVSSAKAHVAEYEKLIDGLRKEIIDLRAKIEKKNEEEYGDDDDDDEEDDDDRCHGSEG